MAPSARAFAARRLLARLLAGDDRADGRGAGAVRLLRARAGAARARGRAGAAAGDGGGGRGGDDCCPSSCARSARATKDSLTYANVRRRLEAARARLGVRRVLAVTPELDGARRHGRRAGAGRARLRAGRRSRRDRARARRHADGLAAVRRPRRRPLQARLRRRRRAGRRAPGFVAVEGNADYPAALAAFRRSLILRRRSARCSAVLAADGLDRAADLGAGRAPGAGGGAPRARRAGRADPDRDARRDRRPRADARRDARGAAAPATNGCR